MKLLTMVWADDTLVSGAITAHMREIRLLVEQAQILNEGAHIWTSTKIVGE